MRRTASLLLLLAVGLGCQTQKKSSYAPRPLELTGYYVDGTGLDVSTLRGKPWLVNLWRPG
jgi:hypothetical protein